MEKYRIVKESNNTFIIEKLHKFLWFKWWDWVGVRDQYSGYYAFEFKSIEEAKEQIRIWTTPSKVVYSL